MINKNIVAVVFVTVNGHFHSSTSILFNNLIFLLLVRVSWWLMADDYQLLRITAIRATSEKSSVLKSYPSST